MRLPLREVWAGAGPERWWPAPTEALRPVKLFPAKVGGAPGSNGSVSLGPLARTQVLSEGLLERCVGGETVAWNHLYNCYYDTARSFLHRMGVRDDALDDACQEVFLEAFRFLPRFRGDCTFKTWLYRLCATQARKTRQRQRVGALLRSLLQREERGSLTDGELDGNRAAQLVQAALAQLTEPERLVFVLYELEGVAGREVATIAGCPEATVWRRLHYARKKFSAYIEGQESAP